MKSSAEHKPDGTVFNPSRMAFARRSIGLSKVELAKRLGVHYRALVAYESGEYTPASETQAAMQTILGFPEQFFYGDDLEILGTSDVSFRSLTKMTARQRDMALSQGELAVHLCRWLERRFELPPPSLPDLSQETDPEAAAEALRELWGVGQLPIRNMIHLLESKGVRVFSLSIDSKEIDAISSWKGGSPYVFLNVYKSAERSRFDAAHELGHLVLHKHGGPQGRHAENEANAFASAFLMPRATVLAHAPKFTTFPEVVRLKKLFGTSVAAVAYRLHGVDLISDWQYRSLSIEISKRGFRTNEPYPMPRETSLVLPKLFASLYEDDGLTRSRIAHELGLPQSKLEHLLFELVMTGMAGGNTRGRVSSRPAKLELVD